MNDDLPDVVYAVRRGERNDALRLSLRSLENLPHRRVFISGYCPSWVKNVTAITAARSGGNKFDVIQRNVEAAVRHVELGQRFVYFNDDFYVMEPLERMPVLNGGPASEYRGTQELRIRMRQTIRVLDNQDMLLFDGVHVPMPIERDLAAQVFAHAPRGILWRTLYGNLAEMTGERIADVKSRDGKVIPGPLMSTNARGLRRLTEYLDDVLPKDCPYV